MGMFISKCCVCGKVYGSYTDNNFEGEKISHGYCSTDCTEAREAQIMVWSDEHDMFVLERAFWVGSKLYYNGAFITDVIVYTKHIVAYGAFGVDGYDLYDLQDFKDEAVSLAVAKVAARNNNVNIIL